MMVGLCIESRVNCLEVSNVTGNVVLICSGMIITHCVCTGQINGRHKIHCMVKHGVKIWSNIALRARHSIEADQGDWKINCDEGMPLIRLDCPGCLLIKIARNKSHPRWHSNIVEDMANIVISRSNHLRSTLTTSVPTPLSSLISFVSDFLSLHRTSDTMPLLISVCTNFLIV